MWGSMPWHNWLPIYTCLAMIDAHMVLCRRDWAQDNSIPTIYPCHSNSRANNYGSIPTILQYDNTDMNDMNDKNDKNDMTDNTNMTS